MLNTLSYAGAIPTGILASTSTFPVATQGRTLVQLEQSPPLTQAGFSLNPQAYFLPSLSDDGRTVVYRAPAAPSAASSADIQAILANTDGTGRRVLSSETSGITETVLSGDGHTVYAATGGGGLVSVDVDSGAVARLLPDASLTAQLPGAVVPGSLVTVGGQSLVSAAGRSQVSLAGYTAPVLATSATSVILQIPWELDLSGPATFIAATPGLTSGE